MCLASPASSPSTTSTAPRSWARPSPAAPHGYLLQPRSRASFAFLPNCSCIRPWLGTSYEFNTNSLGFRDERIREVPLTDHTAAHADPRRFRARGHDRLAGQLHRPRGRQLSAIRVPERKRGRLLALELSEHRAHGAAARASISTRPSSSSTSPMRRTRRRFSTTRMSSGAVAIASQKVAKTGWYSDLRLCITNQFLLTNDVFEFFERGAGAAWAGITLTWATGATSSIWSARRGPIAKFPTPSRTRPATRRSGWRAASPKRRRRWTRCGASCRQRNIPISVVVYPWPAQLAHDTVDSRQVRIWRDWCEGKCKRFVTLFPAFFAIKDAMPAESARLLVPEPLSSSATRTTTPPATPWWPTWSARA